jgi:hypothetical protein
MEKQRLIDLDAFVEQLEPLTMKVNGVSYPVKEPTTEVYLRILRLGELKDEDFEEAQEHFFGIFRDTCPTMPEEVIRNMNGKQITGYLKFLIEVYLVETNDPNAVKPMAVMKTQAKN